MCLVYHTLFADETTPKPQSDAHLYGHVIDSETGEHLPYVTVTIPGTTIGTATDASGHYFLKNLPTGTITVEARMMGYDPVRLRYRSGKDNPSNSTSRSRKTESPWTT